MIQEGTDPFALEKCEEELRAEVNATIKLIMHEMERLADLPPHEANEPVAFNRARHTLIRKIWNLSKECMRYGALAVQRDQHRK